MRKEDRGRRKTDQSRRREKTRQEQQEKERRKNEKRSRSTLRVLTAETRLTVYRRFNILHIISLCCCSSVKNSKLFIRKPSHGILVLLKLVIQSEIKSASKDLVRSPLLNIPKWPIRANRKSNEFVLSNM